MGISVHKSVQKWLRTDICAFILNNHYVNLKTAALESLYRP